jgi:hypothetical protein
LIPREPSPDRSLPRRGSPGSGDTSADTRSASGPPSCGAPDSGDGGLVLVLVLVGVRGLLGRLLGAVGGLGGGLAGADSDVSVSLRSAGSGSPVAICVAVPEGTCVGVFSVVDVAGAGVVEGSGVEGVRSRCEAALLSAPIVVVPDADELPTSADTGCCPIISTPVTIPIANVKTATAPAAILDQRGRHLTGARRGFSRVGSTRVASGFPAGAPAGPVSRLRACRSRWFVRRRDSL